MTVINGTLITTAGQPLIDWQVRATLYAASPVSSSGELVADEVTTTVSPGVWSLDLVPVSALAQPSGAYYSIEVREPPSGDWVRIATCTVPDLGPVLLRDVLVVPAPLNLLVVPQHSPTFTGLITMSGRVVRSVVSLVDAATVAVDASLGDHFSLQLTAGIGATRMLGNPTNAPTSGQDQLLFLNVGQDALGGKALTFDTRYRFGADIPQISLSTVANKQDYIGIRYHPVDNMWDVIAFVKGY